MSTKKSNLPTGIRITDISHQKAGSKLRKPYQADVWDRRVRKYISKCHEAWDLAYEWALDKQAQLRCGFVPAAPVSLRHMGNLWLEHLKRKGCSDGHINGARFQIEQAIAAGITSLTAENIAERTHIWLSELTSKRDGWGKPRPAKASTKNGYLRTLRAVGNYAFKTDRMTRNPFLNVDKFPEHDKPSLAYDYSELLTLVDDKHRGHELWMMGIVGVYTGMRSNEMVQLDWSWIRLREELIILPCVYSKNLMERDIVIQPELLEILTAIPAKKRNGKLVAPDRNWGRNPSDKAGELFSAYLKTIGIAKNGRIVHALRHSCSGLLTATGYSERLVMDQLGHKDRRTADLYSRQAKRYARCVKDWPIGEICLRRELGLRRSSAA